MFDENLITNARIEILNKYVDYFIICESRYDHKGNKKEINFILKNKNYEKKVKGYQSKHNSYVDQI